MLSSHISKIASTWRVKLDTFLEIVSVYLLKCFIYGRNSDKENRYHLKSRIFKGIVGREEQPSEW